MRARIRVMVACWPMCVCVIVVQTTNNKMESAIWKLILLVSTSRTHMPCPNKQSMWAYAYWDGGVGSHNCTGHSKYERSARWHGTFMLSYRKRALQPLHSVWFTLAFIALHMQHKGNVSLQPPLCIHARCSLLD